MEHLLKQGQGTVPDYVRVYESMNGGWVDLHPWHGRHEVADNLETAIILADKGHCVQLLPIIDRQNNLLRHLLLPDVFSNKNPDVRIAYKFVGDIKNPNKNKATKGAIKDAIYRAAQQKVEIVIINLYQVNYSFHEVKEALLSGLQPTRNKSIREIWIITFDKNLLIIPRKMIMIKKFYAVMDLL